MRLTAATLAVCALLVPTGCGGDDGDDSRIDAGLPRAGGGGELSYAVPSLPSTMDPLAAQDRTSLTMVRQIHEPLIEKIAGPYGQTRPEAGLALNARPTRDRTVWRVTLRSGVRFQDGTPFNASSVLANARRWQTDPRGQKLLPDLFGVDAPRPDQVRFLLDTPVPDLRSRLADPRLGIVSPRALDPQSGEGARFVKSALGSGTGPFQRGPEGPGRLALPRFTDWWGSPEGLGPALDGVTFVVAPQPAQRLRMLEDGTVQVAAPLGRPELRAAEGNPLLVTVGGPGSGIGMEGSVRGIDAAGAVPVLSRVWLTRLRG
jgi:peptide/nickel transport system substrate-binding protein